MFQIEKNVPLPTRSGNNARKYPLPDMVVGDSFVVPKTAVNSVRTSARHYALKHPGVKFATRTVKEGSLGAIRVWRTA